MRYYIQSISIFLIIQLGICISSEISASNLLEKSIKRLDGTDYSINIDLTTIKKDETKNKKIIIDVHWSSDEGIYKMIHLEEGENGSKGRELLVYEYDDKSIKTWVKYPKSGKVKELKEKKLSKKVDLSEITIPTSFLNNKIEFSGEEIVNEVRCKIINITDGDELVKLWIDQNDFLIHKKEQYDKKGKLYKHVIFSNLIEENKLKLYYQMNIDYIKDNIKAEFIVTSIEITDFKDLKIFTIPDNEN